MEYKDTWLPQWKLQPKNRRWREVVYRTGFSQAHLSTLITPEELTEFLQAVTAEKDVLAQETVKSANYRPWRQYQKISNMFRSLRKMVRYRHLNSLSEDKMYKVHSTVYGRSPASRWNASGNWSRLNKGSILLFTGMSEFGEAVFMFNGGLITVTGTELDKIRTVVQPDTQLESDICEKEV